MAHGGVGHKEGQLDNCLSSMCYKNLQILVTDEMKNVSNKSIGILERHKAFQPA
jgi:hypothetical protein